MRRRCKCFSLCGARRGVSCVAGRGAQGGRGGAQVGRSPVKGQTLQARRKEENKGKRANHNRKSG